MGRRDVVSLSELTAQSFSTYGWLLGKPLPRSSDAIAFSSTTTDFWQEHVFETAADAPEILWVNYRDSDLRIDRLEVHMLTEQAVVPLTGDIIQIVAASSADGSPDPSSIRAFRVPVGRGICMRPGCWHATRIVGVQVTCAMLTRRSTTADLIGHLKSSLPLVESAFSDVRIQLSLSDERFSEHPTTSIKSS